MIGLSTFPAPPASPSPPPLGHLRYEGAVWHQPGQTDQHQGPRVQATKLANISANITQLGHIAEEQLRETKLQSAKQEQRHLEEDSRRTVKENEDKHK